MTATGRPPRMAMCIEQTLGHRTHGINLERAFRARGAAIDVFRVEFPERGRLPVPWALRSSANAYRQLRRAERYDVTLFHTQTIALLAPHAVRGSRYVVSLDATPLQVDEMSSSYDHSTHPRAIEAAKRRWYRWVFQRAAGVISWSRWAAQSAIEQYGADPSTLLVAHPGAPSRFFDVPRPRPADRPRILFVGGDFERKGGPSLLRAFERLSDRADLLLVTTAPIAPPRGVEVRSDVRPGTPEQFAAFAEADIFCLPTLGDCNPVALGEAMAAGLPVVSTAIGSNPEWVPEGAGSLVPPADDEALAHALALLVDDAARREQMGMTARAHAAESMNADDNAGRVVDFLRAIAA